MASVRPQRRDLLTGAAVVTAPTASGAGVGCPETRVKALDVLSWPCVGARRPETARGHWGNRPRYDGKAVGTVLARYYDPTTGQFLTVDPDVAKALSPYGYAAGDPLNVTDRSGLTPADKWGGGVPFPDDNPFANDYMGVVAEIQWRLDLAYGYNDLEAGHITQIQNLLNQLGNISGNATDASDTLPDWLTEYQTSLQSDLNAFTASFASAAPSPTPTPPSQGPCDQGPGSGGAVLSGCDIPGVATEPGSGFETEPVYGWDPAFATAFGARAY